MTNDRGNIYYASVLKCGHVIRFKAVYRPDVGTAVWCVKCWEMVTVIEERKS